MQGFGRACNANAQIVPMTQEMRRTVLEKHNEIRNTQAMGRTPGYGTAARMGTIMWDDELARFAETRARECSGGHDECRSTGKVYFRRRDTKMSINQN